MIDREAAMDTLVSAFNMDAGMREAVRKQIDVISDFELISHLNTTMSLVQRSNEIRRKAEIARKNRETQLESSFTD